jgi:NADH:ubiquinone oxidoreductase subunit E
MNNFDVPKIIKHFAKDKALLLPVLLAVQDAHPQKYLCEKAVHEIAQTMKISRSRVYSTASFYSEISLKPRGMHLIRVCANSPCENAGRALVLNTIEQELGITLGQTTPDGLFTLESVSCLGACYMSPAIKIDDEVYGHLTAGEVVALIQKLRKEYQNEQIA